MKRLEDKAAAAASLYVQQSLHKQVSQEDCWTAKEDYTAGYCFGASAMAWNAAQKTEKIARATRHINELIRVAEARGDYHSSTAARFILEILK